VFNIVGKYGRIGQTTDDNIIWRMRIACWITKATNTHSEYVILIAFPVQQWLHERTSVLCYTYIVCLVSYCYDKFQASGGSDVYNFHMN